MAVALPEISTPRPPARVGHYAREVFRYPVIPVAVLVIVLLIPALAANWLAPYDPLKGDMTNRFAEPSAQHWFGTDDIGRDVLSRVMHGARVSLLVASVAILISGLIGTSFGIVSAYYGGWADNLMMRLVDISLSLPIIVVAIVVAAMAGPSMKILIAVLVLSQWSRYARLVRGEALTIRAQDYISRARVAGASNFRIMLRYIFPNIVNTIVVLATLQVGFVIVLEATLSFLGAGISRPTPAWGVMVADGRSFVTDAWWLSLLPRAGHPAHGSVDEPAGGLAARQAGPEAAEPVAIPAPTSVSPQSIEVVRPSTGAGAVHASAPSFALRATATTAGPDTTLLPRRPLTR